MDNRTKLIILRGNSGSGKSTVAKVLQEKLGHGTMLISQDVIRREILFVKDGHGTKTLPLLQELLRYGRENCEFVILEGILNASWYRELFEYIKDTYEPFVYSYYYDLPFEETLSRHKTKPNREQFGEEEMKRWWNEKDYIRIIDDKILTKELSVNETVERILKDIEIHQSEIQS